MKPTPEHVWLWHDSYHTPQVSFDKPPSHIQSVEYIRLQTDWNRFKATAQETMLGLKVVIAPSMPPGTIEMRGPHNTVKVEGLESETSSVPPKYMCLCERGHCNQRGLRPNEYCFDDRRAAGLAQETNCNQAVTTPSDVVVPDPTSRGSLPNSLDTSDNAAKGTEECGCDWVAHIQCHKHWRQSHPYDHALWCLVKVTGGLEGPCDCSARSQIMDSKGEQNV